MNDARGGCRYLLQCALPLAAIFV